MSSVSSVSLRAGSLVAVVAAALLLSAVPGWRPLALGTAAAAASALGWLAVRYGRDAAADRRSADSLRRSNAELAKQAEAAAIEAAAARERLRSIIDSALDGIVVIDQTGRIESFNRGAEQLFGYPRSAAIGQNVNLLMPSPDHEQHDDYLRRYLTTGEARIIGVGRQVTARRRDGTVFPVHLSVGEMTIGGARKFSGIIHDLTARVSLEEQLREGAALAKVGEMAAVIAHEVKNPLAGIRAAVQVIGGRLPSDSKDAAVLTDIIKRIDALDGLIKDLLLFARPPQPRLSSVDLAPLLTMTADLLRGDPSLARVTIDVAGSAPPVVADAEMLKIVFQNLLVNSAHAMQGEGRIAVAIGADDGAGRVTVADTGPGMPPEVREKAFTPFFTTKSRGTGLGLPTAKRLIDAHQGDITIDCPPDGGTRVTVRIPARQRSATSSAEPGQSGGSPTAHAS
jgi:two-component system sensor kinase FixL